jgi:DNA-binding CsgD family transcriptional regulator/tetratricopeptide (TPR) repeat protein
MTVSAIRKWGLAGGPVSERRGLVASDQACNVARAPAHDAVQLGGPTRALGSGRLATCPVLIGRDAPLAHLRGLVDRAGVGSRHLMLISGEAGLGKSRLVAEATTYARQRGFRVLTGVSFPRDRACPFGPVVDVLRASLEPLPIDTTHAALRPFARELAPLLPGLVAPPAGLDMLAPAPDIERDRRQLFAALAHCLLGPGVVDGQQPTCLVLEDLHWCDDVSLDFLEALVRGLGQGAGSPPLLILATYRADDATPGLRSWLAGLDRARLAQEIGLRPFSRDETVQLLAGTFGGATLLPVGMADAIHELAEGNPFQIEELLAALVTAGEIVDLGGSWRWSGRPVHTWKLPRSLYESVHERMGRVGHAARELLTLAAVVGRRFDFELLQRLAEIDERTLLALVKELLAAGLVVEEADDRFAFRHALTRQAVYSDLLARERAALHRTVGEIAEQLYAATLEHHAGDLAYHFSEAGSWEKAFGYARRAAARAARLHAPRVVVEQLTRAIDACEKLSGDRASTLATLHLERARASDTAGDQLAAIADAEWALACAQRVGDHRAAWQAQLDLGLYWAGRDYAQARPFLEGALTQARAHGDQTMLGHSLNRLGNWLANTDQPRDALPLHREALAIFERLEDRAGIAATLDLLGMAAFLCADLDSSIAFYSRAVPLMEALDDRAGLVGCLAMLSTRGGCYELASTTTDAADFAQGIHDGDRAIALARSIGWPAGESFACAEVAAVASLVGQYARGLDLAERALTLAQEIGHLQWIVGAHAGLGAIYLDLLALDRAQSHFEQALALAHEIRSTVWIELIIGELAWTHSIAAEGAAPQARAEHLAAAARLLGEPSTEQGPVRSLGEGWITFGQAQLTLAQGDPARALRLFERVTAARVADKLGDQADEPYQEPAMTPRPALGAARALLALGRHAEAEASLRQTLETVQRQDCPSLIWRCTLALADLHAATNRADEAQQGYVAVRQQVEALAAALPEPLLADGLVRQVSARLPRAHRSATRAVQPAGRSGAATVRLTARERDVAGLIAAGHTNREIAEQLVLGERTVETHVSNILGKLALASRRDVARWYENEAVR